MIVGYGRFPSRKRVAVTATPKLRRLYQVLSAHSKTQISNVCVIKRKRLVNSNKGVDERTTGVEDER